MSRGRVLTISDWIQFSIAVIAGLAAILSFFNIRATNKQIKQQKKEWEYANKPILKITYYQDFDRYIVIVIKNDNNVFHKITKVSFAKSEMNLSVSDYGSVVVTDSKTKEKTTYDGMTVTLYPETNEEIIGEIRIKGIDLIGNEFEVTSKEIIIKNKKIKNKYGIRNSYFEFL